MKLHRDYHPTTSVDDLKVIVDQVAKQLTAIKKLFPEFTHMVACGISGQSIAWPVSYITKIPVVVVRKPHEKSHGKDITGEGELKDYVIVDDLISSGATIRYIRDRITAWFDSYSTTQCRSPKLRAIAVYDTHYSSPMWIDGDNVTDVHVLNPGETSIAGLNKETLPVSPWVTVEPRHVKPIDPISKLPVDPMMNLVDSMISLPDTKYNETSQWRREVLEKWKWRDDTDILTKIDLNNYYGKMFNEAVV